jgi:hypothetical protein
MNEKRDLFTDSNSILTRLKTHFSQLSNVYGVNDARQTEIHTVEALVPELSAFEFEMAIEKLKRHKSPGIDQIPADLFKTGSRRIPFGIHKLINSIWNKEELPEEWNESVVVFIYKKDDKTDTEAFQFCQLRTKFYPTSCCQG